MLEIYHLLENAFVEQLFGKFDEFHPGVGEKFNLMWMM